MKTKAIIGLIISLLPLAVASFTLGYYCGSARHGIVREAAPSGTNIIGVTVKPCSKCNGRRFLKHDDYRMPNGEVVSRDVTCSQCKGEGVEGP